jgi:predicted O-methyltransferase YrrM
MDDPNTITPPTAYADILASTRAHGFAMASDLWTGCLLRTLAASRPAGALLELGTGTGLSTVWLLDGMSATSTLVTVDNDPAVVEIARRHLEHDDRVRFHVADGASFLQSLPPSSFDLIFADTWPGKYDHLDEALALLKPGALYIIDDMLPQPNWPEGHPLKVARLIADLENRPDLWVTRLDWSTGLMICTRRP